MPAFGIYADADGRPGRLVETSAPPGPGPYWAAVSRSIARLGEAMERVVLGFRRFTGGESTVALRAHARRADRAAARSRRNQPPRFEMIGLADICPTCGGPGEVYFLTGAPGRDYVSEPCPTCHGVGARPRPGHVGSFSRKRRPHGRPR